MPREIIGKGLRFSLRHAPCAHICRYCLISESRRRSALPFARFEHLVHRFHDWQQAERLDLRISVFVGPSFDYDIETLKGIARLRERTGAKFQILNLGGLRLVAVRSSSLGYRSARQQVLSASTPHSRVAARHMIAGTVAPGILTTKLLS
jgi:hypothetical protein